MPSKTRLANKTIWALEDILALCLTMRADLERAVEQAEKDLDLTLLATVARLSLRIAEIESLARDARNGKYSGR